MRFDRFIFVVLLLAAPALFTSRPTRAQEAWGDISTIDTTGASSGYLCTYSGTKTKIVCTTPATGFSQWTTNGSDIYYNTGNVGIGTTSPTNKLSVSGNINASSFIGGSVYTNNVLSMSGGGTPLNILSYTSAPLILGADNVEKMRIASTGNVGIGTTSPSTALSFGGNAARTVGMERGTVAATAGYNLTLAAGGATSGGTNLAGGDLVLQSGTATGTGTSNITFKTNPAGSSGTSDTSATTAMTILGNGNVGIGTAAPSTKLDVIGATGTNIVTVSDGTRNGGVYINGNGWWVGAYTNNLPTIINANNNGNIHAYTSGGTYFGTYSGRADPGSQNAAFAGNVGIGTTAPAEKLEVSGNAKISGSLQTSDAGTTCTTAADLGKIRYNATTGVYQICSP